MGTDCYNEERRDFLCFHLRKFGDMAGIGLNLFWRDWRRFAIVLNFPYWHIGQKFYYNGNKSVVKGRLFKFVAIGLTWKLRPGYIFKTDTCRIGSEQTVIQSGPDVLQWLQEESMTPFDRLVRDEGLHEGPWGKENP